VLFGFFARERERTCVECGYTWRVPRAIERRGISGMFDPAASSRPRGRGDFTAVIAARADTIEGFRICAKCAVDHFTQRPVRHGG
jgi:hypothetical protein